MFRSKTLFIVGAGASNEVGIKTGAEIRDSIANKLAIDVDLGTVVKGDRAIGAALIACARAEDPPLRNLRPYLEACWFIHDAIQLADSIDDCIHSQRANSRVAKCGKLAIVRTILEEERGSKLHLRPDDRSGFDFKAIEKTWYMKFFRLATSGIVLEDVEKIFENVSFITFNYDRCIEHFLLLALKSRFGLDDERAQAIARRLNILHPYGVVGHLPWQGRSTRVPFGSPDHDRPSDLVSAADQVKTYTERIDDPEQLNALRALVQESEIIVFLGFAYHEQNMALLKFDGDGKAKRVLGTALNFSGSDCALITKDMTKWLGLPRSNASIAAVTCSKLFDEHWRGLQRM